MIIIIMIFILMFRTTGRGYLIDRESGPRVGGGQVTGEGTLTAVRKYSDFDVGAGKFPRKIRRIVCFTY